LEATQIHPKKLDSWKAERLTLAQHIKAVAETRGPLEILEAGCGTRWGIKLDGVHYNLTGLDIDEDALRIRHEVLKDLNDTILGDLRTVELEESKYDIVFNSNVLEHIRGTRQVMDNFVKWLKPGGFIILVMPNGNSAKGFLTKFTPLWFHVLYMRYFRGMKTAGQPGYGPFPTVFDPEVSLDGIRKYCENGPLAIRAEYSAGHGRTGAKIPMALSNILVWGLHLVSFGKLTARHPDLIFIIEKTPEADSCAC
jgi:SAM-dependent methyltransferase